MTTRHRRVVAILGLVLTCPILRETVQAAAPGITVPAGTKVTTLKYSDTSGTAIQLKPAEQVAFLFVYGIQNLESNCLSTLGDPGRLCSLDELVKGVRGKSGTIGLNTDPAQDSNYRYKVEIIGMACVITGLPQREGLGAFAYIGSPNGMHGDFYYNPDGADLTKAKMVGELGYSGKGFTR